jgi:hypothetical protein
MLGYAQTLPTPAPARLSVGYRVSTHHSLITRRYAIALDNGCLIFRDTSTLDPEH